MCLDLVVTRNSSVHFCGIKKKNKQFLQLDTKFFWHILFNFPFFLGYYPISVTFPLYPHKREGGTTVIMPNIAAYSRTIWTFLFPYISWIFVTYTIKIRLIEFLLAEKIRCLKSSIQGGQENNGRRTRRDTIHLLPPLKK